jgi:hypothetical protein
MSSYRYAPQSILINTPFQRGVARAIVRGNRFQRFPNVGQTVETVSRPRRATYTPLKRGVNESRTVASQNSVLRAYGTETAEKYLQPRG